jgi:hypothetical protein
MTDIKSLQDKLQALEEEIRKVKAELTKVNTDKVFKRGYAYKDGRGDECCVVYKDNADGRFLVLQINTNGKLADHGFWHTSGGEFGIGGRSNLIHETERLYDATMVLPEH